MYTNIVLTAILGILGWMFLQINALPTEGETQLLLQSFDSHVHTVAETYAKDPDCQVMMPDWSNKFIR